MPEPETACAAKLKALADATRLAVVEALLEGPSKVHQLQARLGVEQSLLSHHLRVLREIGLVAADRRGRTVVYRLAPGVAPAAGGHSVHLGCCQLSFPAHRDHSEDQRSP